MHGSRGRGSASQDGADPSSSFEDGFSHPAGSGDNQPFSNPNTVYAPIEPTSQGRGSAFYQSRPTQAQNPSAPPAFVETGSGARSSSTTTITVIVLVVIAVVVLIVLGIFLFTVMGSKPSAPASDSHQDTTPSVTINTPDMTSFTSSSTSSQQGAVSKRDDSAPGVFANSSSDDDGDRGFGEVAPTWNSRVSYTVEKATYDNVTAAAGSYDGIDFAIAYPQVKGLVSGQQDTVNAQIKDKAMRAVNRMYLDADDNMKSTLNDMSDDGKTYIASHVTSYITYNDEHLLSVVFVDHYFMGSIYGEFLDMRSLNVNLDTGDAYTIDDIIEPNEGIATQWRDLAQQDNPDSHFANNVKTENLVLMLKNDSSIANRYYSNFFVDEDKNIEIGVTYHYRGDEDGGAIARGWIAEPFAPSSLSSVREDSPLWGLIGA